MPVKDPSSLSKWHDADKFRQRGIFRPTRENPLIGLLLGIPKRSATASPTKKPRASKGRKSLHKRKTVTSDTDASEQPNELRQSSTTKQSSQKRAVPKAQKTVGSSSPLKAKTVLQKKKSIGNVGQEEYAEPGAPQPGVNGADEDAGQSSKTKPKPSAKTAGKKRASNSRRIVSETDTDDDDDDPLELPAAKRQRLSPIAESPKATATARLPDKKPAASGTKRKRGAEEELEGGISLDVPAAATKSTKAAPSAIRAKAVPQSKKPPAAVKPAPAESISTKADGAGGKVAGGSRADKAAKRWAMFESDGEDDGAGPVNASDVAVVGITSQRKQITASATGADVRKSSTGTAVKVHAKPLPQEVQKDDEEEAMADPNPDAEVDEEEPPSKAQPGKKTRKKAPLPKAKTTSRKKAASENKDDQEHAEGLEEVEEEHASKPKRKRAQAASKTRKRAAAPSKSKKKAVTIDPPDDESEPEMKPARKKAAAKRTIPKDSDDEKIVDMIVPIKSAPAASKKKPPSRSRTKASRPPPPRKSMFDRALKAELNLDSEADPLDLFS